MMKFINVLAFLPVFFSTSVPAVTVSMACNEGALLPGYTCQGVEKLTADFIRAYLEDRYRGKENVWFSDDLNKLYTEAKKVELDSITEHKARNSTDKPNLLENDLLTGIPDIANEKDLTGNKIEVVNGKVMSVIELNRFFRKVEVNVIRTADGYKIDNIYYKENYDLRKTLKNFIRDYGKSE